MSVPSIVKLGFYLRVLAGSAVVLLSAFISEGHPVMLNTPWGTWYGTLVPSPGESWASQCWAGWSFLRKTNGQIFIVLYWACVCHHPSHSTSTITCNMQLDMAKQLSCCGDAPVTQKEQQLLKHLGFLSVYGVKQVRSGLWGGWRGGLWVKMDTWSDRSLLSVRNHFLVRHRCRSSLAVSDSTACQLASPDSDGPTHTHTHTHTHAHTETDRQTDRHITLTRSDARRVGKECRSRWVT